MKEKVLFVDDSISIREIVKYSLESDGYEVLLSDNGKNALKCFNGQEIALVLTDMHMPEMNGIELIKNIRKIEQYKKIPLLVLTTETQLEIIMEAKAAGATGWIIKPFVPSKLLETIRKILK
jgi:two-component system, chemotaxis family, chemotaxis protein CheY